MKQRHLGWGGTLLCAAALIICTSAWLNADGNSCINTVLRELPSPNGQLKAVLFERACGATTGFNRHVQILRAKQLPQDDSPFVLDDDHGLASLNVQLGWDGDGRLVVGHDAQARVFRAAPSAGGVAMQYGTPR
jgi:hypothetical protein